MSQTQLKLAGPLPFRRNADRHAGITITCVPEGKSPRRSKLNDGAEFG